MGRADFIETLGEIGPRINSLSPFSLNILEPQSRVTDAPPTALPRPSGPQAWDHLVIQRSLLMPHIIQLFITDAKVMGQFVYHGVTDLLCQGL